MRIDLHTHSAASDGTQAPAELVRVGAASGLDVMAITDHDSTAGWREASVAANAVGIVLVPGVEISCSRAGVSVHLLAYLPDPSSPGLLAEFERTRTERLTRAERMVALIGEDMPLTWDDVLDQTSQGATVGRPHIADAMVAKGIVANRDEAFADVLHSRSRYYVRHYAPDPADAVRLVLEAGGVPVLAHPRARTRGRVLPTEVVLELIDVGLAGLEIDHRDNHPDDRAELAAIATAHGLLRTGSSDYHGAGKQNQIGENLTAPEVFEKIEAMASGTAVVRT